MEDKRLKILKAAFTEKLHIDLKKNPIHYRIEDNVVLLEGLVDKIGQKKGALLAAMGLEGISGVIDRLKVKASKKMTDEEIISHMYNAVREEPTFGGCEIKIEVNDCIADIEGQVPSLSHKRIAGVLAWWIPGSMDVINSLEVVPPEDDSDDEVTDALRLVLEKDKIIDADAITVFTKNWIVTLGGTASSNAERQAAEDDAWYVWGVNGVINNIQVKTGSRQRV